ncbi:NHL repeat-containing protein [Aromatoleum toluclasticum]|uniref:hypothetical protein n=1 Tax=Aromatoleum toluclasticum TaxID=92003 RepID=UPI00037E45F8|nr:hypothetical protein [Aromatoleum toluclasticum]
MHALLRPQILLHPIPTKRQILAGALSLILSITLGGCTAEKLASATEDESTIQLEWPAPPDDPRFIYETRLTSEASIRKETDDERLKRTLTGRSAPTAEPVYRKPAALAARNGRVYVADPAINAIIVFDVPRARAYKIGVREPNHILRPISMAIDGQGDLYVLDSILGKVMVYDAVGLFRYSVGNGKDWTRAAGVAVSKDGKKIFVVDRGSVEGDDHKIIAYAPDGAELFRIGPRGRAPGKLNMPLAATVTPSGTLLVLDSGNFRIQAFDLDGNYKLHFGSVGNGLGQFSRPRSIATDHEGRIYVSDASFNNVQLFSPTGDLLMWIGASGLRDQPGQFGLIAGIAADETGRLYISDHYHRKIEVYRPTGTK